MKQLLVSTVAAAGVAAGAALCATAIAHADNEYAGQTYAQAQQAIQQAGGTDTIATVVGDQLPTTQCRVTGSRSASDVGSSGFSTGTGRILLDLNCSADAAGPGNPGPPAASQSLQDQQAQQQAQAQQNMGDELLQSGNVPGVPNPIP